MANPTTGEGAIISYGIDSRLNNQQILLTTHWKITELSSLDVDIFEAMAGLDIALDSPGELVEVYRSCQSNQVISGRQLVQLIWPVRYVRDVRPSAHPAGTLADPCNRPNSACVITTRGPVANKTNVGNKHIAGAPDSAYAAGMITVAQAGRLDDLGLKLITPIEVTCPGGDTYTAVPVIYHRAAPNQSAEPAQYDVWDTARVMRRRTVGQGS